MKSMQQRPLIWASILFFGLSLWIRYELRGVTNLDTVVLEGWYAHIYQNGFGGLSDATFSNYPPFYLYLLWLSTLFSKWFGSLAAIKIIPTLFDFLSAYVIFLIAQTKYKNDLRYLLASVFFLLPTILLNSTVWGQIDGMYTSFLLLCVYFLLQKKSFWALAAFGFAFSVKAQAIFLLPFLGIMLLRGIVNWKHFFLAPAIYLFLAIPITLTGRSWASVIFLYAGQAGQFQELSKLAPNLYIYISNIYYHPVLEIGLGIFILCMAAWAWINWKAKPPVSANQIMLTALASLALAPFLLPKMHDRYFYPADVFSFAAAILLPKLWFLSILFQLASGLTYTVFLFGVSPVIMTLTSLLMTAAVILVTRVQLQSLKNADA